MIVTWERGNEKALVLGTDLGWQRRKVVAVFKGRMSIEELFRDEKPKVRPFREHPIGWGLRQMKVGNAARLDRMLLVLAFAYLLLLMMGVVCRETMSETYWASATTKTKDQACRFTIGRYMLNRVK